MAGELERLLIRLEADTTQLRRAMANADKDVANFASRADRHTRNVDATFARLGGTFKAALGGYAIAAAFKQTVELADAYTRMGNRLAVVTKSADEFEYVQRRLVEVSQEARVAVGDTADIYSRYAFALKDAGVSTNDVLKFTEALSKAVVISGASSAEASGALLQLSQGLAAGVLRGQELNSVMEQMPIVADLIARKLGVTTGQLKKMGEEGKITSDIVVDAVVGSLAELDEKFSKTAPTIEQGMTQLNNAFSEFVGIADKSAGASATIAGEIDKIATSISNANQKWKDGASWWEWFKAWKGKDFSDAWDAAAGNSISSDWQTTVAPASGFDPNARGAKRTPAAADPWAASIIPPDAAEQLRELEQAWNELNAAQMDTLNDLIDSDITPASAKMDALTAAVERGEIGWRDYLNGMQAVSLQSSQIMDDMASSMSQTLGAIFKESKTAAIAQALINTYQGISKAIAHYPPPYSYAMAAMQAAQGFAQVSAIRSTSQTSSGSGRAATVSSGAAASGGASPAAAATAQDRAYTVRLSSAGDMLGRKGLRELLENIADMQRDGYRLVVT